jgi:hypothetical protein
MFSLVRWHIEWAFDRTLPFSSDAGLYVVGSTVNGLGNYRSILDVCLMISHETLTDVEREWILEKLGDVFRRSGEATERIRHARSIRTLKNTFTASNFNNTRCHTCAFRI